MMDRRAFLNRSTVAASLWMGGGFGRALGFDEKSGSPGAVAETTSGKIRGAYEDQVYSFRGVRYGASTAGANRFMPPVRPEPWSGIRDALTLGLRAPQLPSNLVPEWGVLDRTEPMGEDCLCLNVWTAGLANSHERPVMVWLHGGGFAGGSDGFLAYDGTELAKKHDVVVVGINHRLNIFGFLYLAELGGEKYAHSSNVGMLDIVAALEWVRDNIANFGGDPNNVTIFGQSGGGSKVTTLLAMPPAKGLFHRAIAESGVNLRGVDAKAATKSAESIMAKLGLQPNQVNELQKLPMHRLLGATEAGGAAAGNPALRLAPVLDGRTLPAGPFAPAAPRISANVPLLVGNTETEVTFRPSTQYDPLDDSELREKVKQELHIEDAAADKLIATYRRGRPKSSNLDLYLIIASDGWLRQNVITVAERKAALHAAPAYAYYFTWRSPAREGRIRSMHTMEIPFVYDNVDVAKDMLGTGEERYALAEKMSGAWVAFARTGNPNHEGLPEWPAYDGSRRATMIFNNQCKVVDDPYKAERLAMTAVREKRS
jgi:para-nitrobenzyl esterase